MHETPKIKALLDSIVNTSTTLSPSKYNARLQTRLDLSDFLDHILNGKCTRETQTWRELAIGEGITKVNPQNTGLWQVLLSRPKLADLDYEDQKKIIDKMPASAEVIDQLINRNHFDQMIPQHSATVYCKILQISDEDDREEKTEYFDNDHEAVKKWNAQHGEENVTLDRFKAALNIAIKNDTVNSVSPLYTIFKDINEKNPDIEKWAFLDIECKELMSKIVQKNILNHYNPKRDYTFIRVELEYLKDGIHSLFNNFDSIKDTLKENERIRQDFGHTKSRIGDFINHLDIHTNIQDIRKYCVGVIDNVVSYHDPKKPQTLELFDDLSKSLLKMQEKYPSETQEILEKYSDALVKNLLIAKESQEDRLNTASDILSKKILPDLKGKIINYLQFKKDSPTIKLFEDLSFMIINKEEHIDKFTDKELNIIVENGINHIKKSDSDDLILPDIASDKVLKRLSDKNFNRYVQETVGDKYDNYKFGSILTVDNILENGQNELHRLTDDVLNKLISKVKDIEKEYKTAPSINQHADMPFNTFKGLTSGFGQDHRVLQKLSNDVLLDLANNIQEGQNIEGFFHEDIINKTPKDTQVRLLRNFTHEGRTFNFDKIDDHQEICNTPQILSKIPKGALNILAEIAVQNAQSENASGGLYGLCNNQDILQKIDLDILKKMNNLVPFYRPQFKENLHGAMNNIRDNQINKNRNNFDKSIHKSDTALQTAKNAKETVVTFKDDLDKSIHKSDTALQTAKNAKETVDTELKQLGKVKKDVNEVIKKADNTEAELGKVKQNVNNLTQEHQKTQQDVSVINLKIDKEITPNIKSLKDNLDDVVKKLNYSSEEIKVLKDLMGAMEGKIDAIKDPSEQLAELEAFQEILKPLAEIAKEPEFINALKAMHKGYKIDVDFNRQLKILQKILSEKIPNNEIAQEKIVKFAKGYQGALSQLYVLAPGFSSSVLSTNVGKKATMIKMVSTALNTACSEVPVAKTGAALVCGELDKMAASQSANIISDIRALGEVADGQTDPDNRADKDKKNVAFQVINQHVLHIATHLSEDPQKLNQLEEATLKSTKKIKDYHGKALEALRGIAEDIEVINSGDASSGNIVSEILHQKIPNITPIEEAACRMTASSLTSALPAFMQGTKSRTEREATIRAVDLRNILHSNTPSNNNNQTQSPYRPHNRFGNMGV